MRFFSGEDNWICENGKWIKHGNPSNPPPSKECLANQNIVPTTNLNNKEIETEDFKFALPTGWQITKEPMEGIDTMAISVGEKTNDVNANKIGFKSYFAFTHSPSTKSLDEYLVDFKEEINKSIDDYQIENMSEGLVDNNQAKFFELKFTQQNIDFRAFIGLFKGKDNTIWSFSLNTTQLLWNEYTSLIPELLNSIKFK